MNKSASTISKWGIIGPGNIAGEFIKDLKLVRGSQEVVSILGRSQKSIQSFSAKYQVQRSYTKLKQFIDDRSMDAVYIATPHPFHFEAALACLENGIPVLCEKPLCINGDQCRDLIAASRKNDTFLMEGMWIRFLPSIKQALALVRQGKIGEILQIKAAMNYKAPLKKENRYFNPSLGGGSLLDLGIYPVFLAILFRGSPSIIKAVGSLTGDAIDKNCSVLLNFKDGCVAMLDSSLLLNSSDPAEIQGTLGSIKIQHPWFEKSPGVELNFGDNRVVQYPTPWEGHGLRFEVEEVIRCIGEGKIESDLLSHTFSQQVIDVLDEIRRQVGVKYELYE